MVLPVGLLGRGFSSSGMRVQGCKPLVGVWGRSPQSKLFGCAVRRLLLVLLLPFVFEKAAAKNACRMLKTAKTHYKRARMLLLFLSSALKDLL